MKTFGHLPTGAECFHRPGSYGLIFREEQEILLVHTRRPDVFYLPGGGIEAGETPEEALIREVWEETGYQVDVLDSLGQANEFFFATKFGSYYNKIGNYFSAQVIGGHPDDRIETDHFPQWLNINQIINQMGHQSEQYMLQKTWEKWKLKGVFD